MNYTLNQIRVYLKIVETESITKAAEELYMTQPAVSIQLKNFQDQFEVPLTELVGRKLHITEFGYEIAEIAEKAFLELENLRFKTLEFKGLLSGKLKISSASTGKYVIPFFLSEFLQGAPGINLVLDVTNKSRVLESLKQNEIDFAIVSVIPKDLEVAEEKLVENKLFLVSDGKGNPKKKPLIFREEGSATRQEMERYFQQHGSKDRKKLELTSNEAVKQAVVAGLGNSIVPLIGIKNELLNKSIHIVPRRGLPLKTDWRLIWLKSKRLSPVAQAYLDYVRGHKEEIIEKHFKWYEEFEGKDIKA